MDNKSIDFILDNYKGKRRERALKVALNKLKTTDIEFKKYALNELVRFRWSLIKNYKSIELLHEYIRITEREYKKSKREGDIVKSAEVQLYISDVQRLIKDVKEIVASYGGIIASFLRFNILSEHEVCQVFNINHKVWEKQKSRYMSISTNKENLVYSIIAITGVEYRKLRGRKKGYYDCPDYEMPVYWGMHEYMMHEMRNNEEFHKATTKAFKELFPKIKTYTAVKDLEGNIVKLLEDK